PARVLGEKLRKGSLQTELPVLAVRGPVVEQYDRPVDQHVLEPVQSDDGRRVKIAVEQHDSGAPTRETDFQRFSQRVFEESFDQPGATPVDAVTGQILLYLRAAHG